MAQINVPATIMYATGKEGCGVRKPEPGMWEFFVEHLNGGVQPGKLHALQLPFPHHILTLGLSCVIPSRLDPITGM